MNAIIGDLAADPQNAELAAVFLDALLKSMVVLALAGGVCALWRGASAATRHLVWFLAVAILPWLPLMNAARPAWQKPVWTISSASGSGNQVSLALELTPNAMASARPARPDALKIPATAQAGAGRQVAAEFNAGWMWLGGLVWLSGVVAVLARLAAGQFYRRRFLRAARRMGDAEWSGLLGDACGILRLRRRVSLWQSAHSVMPVTWGWWRPAVLLPAEASRWTAARRRIVLLHELAHVKRQDYLTQTVAQLVCALYWFNPLVWVAARQMCVEREGACDDLVLAGGCKASEYAGHLVEIAGSYRRVPRMAAIAMARSSKLEGRITAIVDVSRNRRLRWLGAAAALALIGGIAVMIGGSRSNAAAGAVGGGSLATGSAIWTNWNNHQAIGSFYAVAGTAREVVAVGIDGRIATRDNATGVWKIQTFTGDPDFRAIVYANNEYVVVREAGSIMTSPDGLEWQVRSSPTRKSLFGLNWVGDQFLAGGAGGTILSSPDGVTWTRRDSGSHIDLYRFSYSGSRYVAVGMNGILVSSNAITWTKPWQAPTWVPFTACVWTGEEFLACGLGLDKNPTIYTSPDGEVWTLRDTTITASLRAAAVVDGAIYVAGDSVVAKSEDGGTTWAHTFHNSGGNKLFMGLASDGKYLLAAGFNHNVWAMPETKTSPSAQSKASVIRIRLVSDEATADTEVMTEIERSGPDPSRTISMHVNVDKAVLLDGTAVQSAQLAGRDSSGRQQIGITFTEAGRVQFAEITRRHIHEQFAILIDGRLWEAPMIQSEISEREVPISGGFSEAEAEALVAKINDVVGK